METKVFDRSRLSPVILYSILIWTLTCFVGTWYVIFKYGIFWQGFLAFLMTLFFGAAIWTIPLAVLVLLSLFVTPSEEPPPRMMFKDLIRRGMSRNPE